MFDTYRVGGPSRIDVSVKEAPTADSARLYGELLEKARAEILETLEVKNELVDFQALRLDSGLQRKIVVAFRLNGELFVAECKFDYILETLYAHRMELIRYVLRLMSDAIAERLLTKLDQMTI